MKELEDIGWTDERIRDYVMKLLVEWGVISEYKTVESKTISERRGKE